MCKRIRVCAHSSFELVQPVQAVKLACTHARTHAGPARTPLATTRLASPLAMPAPAQYAPHVQATTPPSIAGEGVRIRGLPA